ncbi:MAG: DUF3943 domain-containing protein [Ignavibacteriaceae bacterium]
MKLLNILFFLLLISGLIQAQSNSVPENKMPLIQDAWLSRQLPDEGITNYSFPELNQNEILFPDNIHTLSQDTLKYNMYGYLLNDNPEYNNMEPLWTPVIGVIAANAFTNLLDTYILKYDWSRVGFVSWGRNLHAGFPWTKSWIWAPDRFGENMLLHPYGGGEFFNAARANGYTFWESTSFVLFGSYMWKIFGETGTPERNSLIATTMGGVSAGEILYRISSDVLDDQSTGSERIFREIAAGVIDPVRFVSRLFQGKLSNVTAEPEYQKEPLNITVAAGAHWINDGASFGTGGMTELLNLNLDYGNPFENISRNPYDYFTVRGDLNFGVGRKVVDAVDGFGILTGKNSESGNLEMLTGLYQYYDYFDNRAFELGTFGVGGAVMTKLKLNKSDNLYTNLHVVFDPFGGNSRVSGPDTSQLRDYEFGGGAHTMLETTLNLGGWINFSITGYYYWFHTYSGTPGDNYIALFNPSISLNVYKDISAGIEQVVYYSDRYSKYYSSTHTVRTEQKLFVQIYLENFKFRN